MSKRSLQKYLSELTEDQLREQLMHLYTTFKDVKVYYDFVFNPREEKLVNESKEKIANEYFPVRRKRPRARRSVAQNYIKHFMTLGVNPLHIADIMWFNLEIAVTFNKERKFKQEAFYKSMAKSFDEGIRYCSVNGLTDEFLPRIRKVYEEVVTQNWSSLDQIERSMELLSD
ncbi:hypothetical protein E7Z59_01995 [Robertkochia marina]|uniref:Uncharacterized protein n=1 Tax=Robertkochia marina TaxID=1227945 RepID=A0A4S3M239_9FLAO|nr:DUF6155 family protein [Robertkochia marina]THD69126.1 hypothetical protein E7Z59_01995 [Robertkochia marina]TRZ47615.1 hypothetical protein D3A96_02610 [Robertkochia marina]